MTIVALETGDTRGIGEAICIKLHDKGYKVVANYGGNDQKAADFKERTGIATKKFDVSDFEAIAAGIADIEKEFVPVDVSVNNADITRDGTMHRRDFVRWDAVIQTILASCFDTRRAVI